MRCAGIAMSWIAGGESCRGSRGKAALYSDRAAERVHHLPAVRKPNAIAHGRGQYLAAGLVHDLIARRLVVVAPRTPKLVSVKPGPAPAGIMYPLAMVVPGKLCDCRPCSPLVPVANLNR